MHRKCHECLYDQYITHVIIFETSIFSHSFTRFSKLCFMAPLGLSSTVRVIYAFTAKSVTGRNSNETISLEICDYTNVTVAEVVTEL